MTKLLLIVLAWSFSGCAYRLGLSERTLPGGYTQVAIPVFQNESAEVGVETSFTNSIIRRINRSQVARVTEKDLAPLVLEGTIKKVAITGGAAVTNSSGGIKTLPDETVLNTQYTIVVDAELILRRKSDDKVIWNGRFSNEKVYAAPRIGTPVLNSANATYNQSAKMETLARLAEEMMAEAHDRMTENF